MKCFALLLCGIASLAAPPVRDGNFEIRFEPTAKLQTNVQVPFEVTVKDGRKQPLIDATVVMQIEMIDHTHMAKFKAPAPNPAVTPGIYVAKPTFPVPGQWNVFVSVQRDDQESERTIQFNVVE